MQRERALAGAARDHANSESPCCLPAIYSRFPLPSVTGRLIPQKLLQQCRQGPSTRYEGPCRAATKFFCTAAGSRLPPPASHGGLNEPCQPTSTRPKESLKYALPRGTCTVPPANATSNGSAALQGLASLKALLLGQWAGPLGGAQSPSVPAAGFSICCSQHMLCTSVVRVAFTPLVHWFMLCACGYPAALHIEQYKSCWCTTQRAPELPLPTVTCLCRAWTARRSTELHS